MSKKLSITKITDKEEILDVQGQGCKDDCVHHKANVTSSEGCGTYADCSLVCAL